MSKWTNKYDFRDYLDDELHNNFHAFYNNLITVFRGDLEVEIKEPADLIPYYNHIVEMTMYVKGQRTVVLSEYSYTFTRIKELNYYNNKFGNDKFKPFKTDYLENKQKELDLLYETERMKPENEQRII